MEGAVLQPLHAIYLLLDNVYTKRHSASIESIIKLNTGGLAADINSLLAGNFQEHFDPTVLEKLNEDDLMWQKPTPANLARKAILTGLLGYTGFNHIDLINMNGLQQLITIKHIKIALSRSSFINFSVKDNFVNMHLTLQGQFLQYFLYYHLKYDMRSRARIDSLFIEMDNPYQR